MGLLMGLTMAGSITWSVLHGLQRFDRDNLICGSTVILTDYGHRRHRLAGRRGDRPLVLASIATTW